MLASAPVVLSLVVLMLAACSSTPEVASGTSPWRAQTRVTAQSNPSAGRQASSVSSSWAVATSASTRGDLYGSEGPKSVLHGDYAGYPAAARLVDKLVREEGFDRAYLTQVLARVERQQWILDFVNRPKSKKSAGPTGAWSRYRAKFLTRDNISNGVSFWRRYDGALRRAQAKYGVPPEYVVAILGVETRYGGYTGKHRVIDALATLAFDYPRRSDYFTGELEAFLIMSRDEGFDPFLPRGSYAGAMGLGQFMPSSFRKWAVDFNGDGERNLWNPVDAIGSVANYFASHGWRKGEAVAVRARSGYSGARGMTTGFDTSYSLDALSRNGILAAATLDTSDPVSLIELDARGGYEYWVGLKNFYVITRYNHSSYYAMAVHQLAQAVGSRFGPVEPVLTRAEQPIREPVL
jgi:membrane-bound lytic murein transglycosylase B